MAEICGLPVSCDGPEWAGLWGVAEPACTFIKVKHFFDGKDWCDVTVAPSIIYIQSIICSRLLYDAMNRKQEAVSPLDWLYMLVQSCFWGHLLVIRKDCRFKARCYSHLLYTVCGRGSFLTIFVFLLCKDLRFVVSCVVWRLWLYYEIIFNLWPYTLI